MVEQAERYKEQDEQIKAAIAAKNELEMYVYQVKSMVSGKPGKLTLCCGMVQQLSIHKELLGYQSQCHRLIQFIQTKRYLQSSYE